MKDIIDCLIADWKQEKPELDANAMHIVGRILKLGKLLEKRASASIDQYNIHYTDLDVLATLRRSGHPYELSPKELMHSVLITSGAMTALLDRLTKLELVYRSPDPNDGRIKKAGLTQSGIQLIEGAIEARFREAKTSVEVLSDQEQKELGSLLKKLLLSIN